MTTTAPYTTYETMPTFTTTYSHAPSYNLIDLDYPMYSATVVKCGGQNYDLEVVKAALKLVNTLKGQI